MPERRRKFSPEFRDEAVKMVVGGDRPAAQVARELGINPGTLANWVTSLGLSRGIRLILSPALLILFGQFGKRAWLARRSAPVGCSGVFRSSGYTVQVR
jgi:hypothetical protein